MKKAHPRSNLIGFCRGVMRLHHRNTSIFFVLFLLSLIFIATILALYFIQASYILGVQITVSKYRIHCETIHVASVVAGHSNTRHFVTLVKSILSKSQNPIHFHLITDEQSHMSLKTLFSTWEVPGVATSFYNASSYVTRVDWIPNAHYSGIFGMMKLVIPDIIPDYVDKLIVLDTDTFFLSDVVELWTHFSFMGSHEYLGMADNLSGWYTKNTTGNKWPAIGNGFNSGVILINLAGIRPIWHYWKEIAFRNLRNTGRTMLADQDIFNAVLVAKSEMLYVLPAEYNLQVGTKSTIAEKLLPNARVIHVNNRNKCLESYPHLERIRSKIEDIDASIFSLTRQSCSYPYLKEDNRYQRNECDRFVPLSFYRTQLLQLPFEIPNSKQVTLVSQLSCDRLYMLDTLLATWKGPVSIALYGSDKEINDIVLFIARKYTERKNIGLHGVYSQGNMYPVNYLRNVALNHTKTEFVFLLDADFIIYNEEEINSLIQKITSRSVLVVPAFEFTENENGNIPLSLNKSSLIDLVQTEKARPFKMNVWPKGHNATKFEAWINSTNPYDIEWESDFEPYIIGRKSDIPIFDERFGGFGWNKVTHSFEMKMKQLKFLVHPTSFILHQSHIPSNELVQYRSDALYRKCMLIFKREFVNDLLMSQSDEQ